MKPGRELGLWRDLASVMCRDGGHYHHANGAEATVEHCKAAYIDLLQENERLKTEREAFVAVDDDRIYLFEKIWQALGGESLPEDPSPEPSPPVSGCRDLDAMELAKQRMVERANILRLIRRLLMKWHSGKPLVDDLIALDDACGAPDRLATNQE